MSKLNSGFTTNKAYVRSGKFASQAVENVRTVASLGRLNTFFNDYLRALALPNKVQEQGRGAKSEDTVIR
jgi:hypothetical protein